MEQNKKEKYKKGFNHGYILSSAPSSDKVVDQLMKAAKNIKTTPYSEGFNSGISQHQKEKAMEKGMSKVKQSLSKMHSPKSKTITKENSKGRSK